MQIPHYSVHFILFFDVIADKDHIVGLSDTLAHPIIMSTSSCGAGRLLQLNISLYSTLAFVLRPWVFGDLRLIGMHISASDVFCRSVGHCKPDYIQ